MKMKIHLLTVWSAGYVLIKDLEEQIFKTSLYEHE
jgi:hypothetical protein